jgi:hypothetical protein
MIGFHSRAESARIGPVLAVMESLFQRMRQAWGSPNGYRPSDHYMRGPGPKWREKHGLDRTATGLVQHPMLLGDKWDF